MCVWGGGEGAGSTTSSSANSFLCHSLFFIYLYIFLDPCQDAKVTVHIHRGDESQMVTAVLQRPLVVYIDASKATFQFYKSGVYSDPDCSQGQPDHAMQLVGYGVDRAGTPYWILKNSWGESALHSLAAGLSLAVAATIRDLQPQNFVATRRTFVAASLHLLW